MNIKAIWHEIKKIPIIGVPYDLLIGKKREKRDLLRLSAIVREQGSENIALVESILDKTVHTYFADCGTLLGVLRDHDFISWDPDIDYGIVVDDDFSWEALEKEMNANGYRKTKEWVFDGKITEQSYVRGQLGMDFFAHFPTEDGRLLFYSYARILGKWYSKNYHSAYVVNTPSVTATRKELLGGIPVNVPENAEDYIAYIYNDDWRTPNPNWVPFSGKGCSYIEDKQSEMFDFR